MTVSYALAGSIGLVLGLIANILADVLPWLRADEIEYEDESDEPLEGEAVNKTEPRPRPDLSVKRLLSPRYLIVLALMVAASLYLWNAGEKYLVSRLFYLTVFVLIAIIDIEHKLILGTVMIPAFILAFIEVAITQRITIPDALVGYATGQIILMFFYLLGALYIWLINARRNEPIREVAFGFGDVTLATFCGLILGWPWVLYMVVVMIVVGGLMAFVFLILRLVIVRRYEAHMAMPYGPAIVIAAAITLLWANQVGALIYGGGR